MPSISIASCAGVSVTEPPRAVARRPKTSMIHALGEDEQMARDGVLLQMFLDQRRKSVETLAHVGMAERQVHVHACRNDDYDAFRRTAASPPPDWCPPVQKHAVHRPVRWLSSRPALAPRRTRQRAAAVPSSSRRRTPPLPARWPIARAD